jgi:4-hydroxy-tetrahydrodipicolinate reductase
MTETEVTGTGTKLRVAVLGAGGRMGTAVCSAIDEASDLDLVAAVDPHRAGGVTAEGRTIIGELDGGLADVVVDFTVPTAVMENLRWCAAHRLHAVVGTTGLAANDLDELAELYPSNGDRGCIVAPNFAIGAVLMMRFAELAAPWFATAEIIELHHDAKVDAPSGTARSTAARMAAASSSWAPDPTTIEEPSGARGGLGPAGIRIHSVRLRGVVANQEVILGDAGQTLTIRHDSTDRVAFMPGVLVAVRAVAARPGLTVGLDALLGV